MLKALQVERAKPRSKPYKLAHEKGLHLYVATSGARSWRVAYRFAGKSQLLTLGKFPEISLKRAGELLADARKLLANGQKPTPEALGLRKEKPVEAGTFKALAEEWYKAHEAERSHSWRDNISRWLDDRIYPAIGRKALKDIQPADVLTILKAIDREGKARSAESVRQLISQVFDYAIRNLWATFNPAQSLSGAIKVPAHKPHPHLSEKELPGFLARLDSYPDKTIRHAISLLFLTATRKRELLGARWSEIDLERAEWRIPAERMKQRREHIVPLSRQALEILSDLKADSEFVFPSPVNPRAPMTKMKLDAAFKTLGDITPHGARSTFSTIANERSGFPGDVIETYLAHVERDQVRASYNRATWLEQRAKLGQWWADYLDNARVGNVVTLPRRA